MLVKLQVVAGDGDDRGGHGLLDVARRQRRPQPLLGLLRAQEDDPHRRLVGRGRAHLGEVERLDQQLIRHGPIEEGVVGSRLGEDLGLGGRADGGAASILDDGHVLSPYTALQHGHLQTSAQLAKL